jgi:hypothetical protein
LFYIYSFVIGVRLLIKFKNKKGFAAIAKPFCGAGGNRTLVRRCDTWRFLHVYFCLLSGIGRYKTNLTKTLTGVLMAHLAGVSDHIHACRPIQITRRTDNAGGTDLQLLITPD